MHLQKDRQSIGISALIKTAARYDGIVPLRLSVSLFSIIPYLLHTDAFPHTSSFDYSDNNIP